MGLCEWLNGSVHLLLIGIKETQMLILLGKYYYQLIKKEKYTRRNFPKVLLHLAVFQVVCSVAVLCFHRLKSSWKLPVNVPWWSFRHKQIQDVLHATIHKTECRFIRKWLYKILNDQTVQNSTSGNWYSKIDPELWEFHMARCLFSLKWSVCFIVFSKWINYIHSSDWQPHFKVIHNALKLISLVMFTVA